MRFVTRLSPSSAWRLGLEKTAERLLAQLAEWSRRLAGIPGIRPAAATLGTLLVVFVSWRAWQGAEFGDVSVLALMAVGVLSVPLLLAADGTEFAQPVQLTIHFDPSNPPEYGLPSLMRLLKNDNGYWVNVEGSTLDQGASTVTGQIHSFSQYSAGVPPLPFNFGYGILFGPGQSNIMVAKKI